MIFASLGSGSRGNCTLLSTGKTTVLVDCGLPFKRIKDCLESLGISPCSVSGIFLTHEHTDHIKGLKRFMTACNAPVYGSSGTLEALYKVTCDSYFQYAGKELMFPLNAGCPVRFEDFTVTPFHTYHDADMPFGWRFDTEQDSWAESLTGAVDYCPRKHVSCAVLTDCGHFDDYICSFLKDLDILLLEANHDRGMLMNGPYPMMLKRRIMSSHGHMSNNAAGQLLAEILTPRLRHVFLAHLSRDNNTPETALNTVRSELRNVYGERAASSVSISAAPQEGMSQIIEL